MSLNESTQEMTQKLNQETIQKLKQEILQQLKQEIIQKLIQEPIPESKQEFSQETKQEFSQETKQEFSQETEQELSQETKQELSQGTSQESIQDLIQESIQEPIKQNIKEPVKETYFLSEIDGIVDERVVKQQQQYLVRWKDFPDEDNQWIPASQLNCPYLINEYKKNHGPKKRNLKKVEHFLSGHYHDGQLYYSVQYFSGDVEEITANYAHSFLTQQLLTYLESIATFPEQNSEENTDN